MERLATDSISIQVQMLEEKPLKKSVETASRMELGYVPYTLEHVAIGGNSKKPVWEERRIGGRWVCSEIFSSEKKSILPVWRCGSMKVGLFFVGKEGVWDLRMGRMIIRLVIFKKFQFNFRIFRTLPSKKASSRTQNPVPTHPYFLGNFGTDEKIRDHILFLKRKPWVVPACGLGERERQTVRDWKWDR